MVLVGRFCCTCNAVHTRLALYFQCAHAMCEACVGANRSQCPQCTAAPRQPLTVLSCESPTESESCSFVMYAELRFCMTKCSGNRFCHHHVGGTAAQPVMMEHETGPSTSMRAESIPRAAMRSQLPVNDVRPMDTAAQLAVVERQEVVRRAQQQVILASNVDAVLQQLMQSSVLLLTDRLRVLDVAELAFLPTARQRPQPGTGNVFEPGML